MLKYYTERTVKTLLLRNKSSTHTLMIHYKGTTASGVAPETTAFNTITRIELDLYVLRGIDLFIYAGGDDELIQCKPQDV